MTQATRVRGPAVEERRWSGRLICWLTVLVLANRVADTVITSPEMVLQEMLEHFGTDQVAWLNSSALLAGAIWSPLLAKSADIFGKRRVLLVALLLAGAGSVVCLVAPNLGVFLLGRLLQGAGMAVVFLTVALTRQICPPRVAMTAVGIVASCSALLGIAEPFLMEPIIARFGFQSVFVVSVALAAAAVLSVRRFIPESPVRSSGRVDVGGALLFGGGLAAVLGYVSLGEDFGWLSGGMVVLLAAGAAALAGWVFLALRVDEPIVDIRALSRPLVLMLLAVVLAAGSFQAMIQLRSIVAEVPVELELGYGLGGAGPSALLFAAPAPGLMLGGTFAGWLATRIGPARTLLGGIALGTLATFMMLAGVSSFPLMLACVGLLGTAAGAISTSGFNLATGLAPPERHGVVTGLVSVVLATGGVVVNVVGGAVLNATDTVVDGAPRNSATGVYLYVLIVGMLFVLAAVTTMVLLRTLPGTAPEPARTRADHDPATRILSTRPPPAPSGPRPGPNGPRPGPNGPPPGPSTPRPGPHGPRPGPPVSPSEVTDRLPAIRPTPPRH